MKVVDYRDFPKPTALRDIGVVAHIEGDLDAIATMLSTKSKAFTQRATKTDPQVKYKSVFLKLSNGKPAELTEYLDSPGSIELNLQILKNEFVFEDDFSEIISWLNIDPERVQKLGGVYITWLPNRKAKMVRRKEEPLPEDWWNHVPSISFANTPPKK